MREHVAMLWPGWARAALSQPVFTGISHRHLRRLEGRSGDGGAPRLLRGPVAEGWSETDMAALGRLVVGRARSRIRGSNPDLATRYDKLAVRYEATIHVTAMNEWLHALRDTT